jgi:hypothetical protein
MVALRRRFVNYLPEPGRAHWRARGRRFVQLCRGVAATALLRFAVAALAALSCATGCSPVAKRETADLADVVDHFRRADNTAKPDLAAAAANLACTDRDVCAARDACASAMKPTAWALVLKDDVARTLDAIQAGKLAPDAPEKWSACEHTLAELRVRYGV